MNYLLDVNVLLAALWTDHSQHAKAKAWLQGKNVALCPITELGFLRISTNPKALKASMQDANTLLNDFWKQAKPDFVPCDLAAAPSPAKNSDQVTDVYLADLAGHHKRKLATFDTGIAHAAVEQIR